MAYLFIYLMEYLQLNVQLLVINRKLITNLDVPFEVPPIKVFSSLSLLKVVSTLKGFRDVSH